MIGKLLKTQEVRYGISSALSFVIDNALYYLFLLIFGMERKVISQIAARVLSSLFNFNMNKYFAYRKKDGYFQDMLKYYCVCIPQTMVTVALTYLVQRFLQAGSPAAATAVKICVDAALFVASFFIQKIWVFKK